MDQIDPDLLKRMIEEHGLGLPELDVRDHALMLLSDLEYDAQFRAIKELLERQTRLDAEMNRELHELENQVRQLSGWNNERANDEYGERFYASVYQEAAHSMAAVGMLAPFIESLFHHALLKMGALFAERGRALPPHSRFRAGGDDVWDCHKVWNGQRFHTHLLKGIEQLSSEVGLTSHMPSNLSQVLEALFAYRNKMFHNGFEWPMHERHKFEHRTQHDWPSGWFSSAKTGEDPWIFYMTEEFITEVLAVMDRVILGMGAFARDFVHGVE